MAAKPRRRKTRGGLASVALQFAGPSGPAGHLVTWPLARGNAGFNRWLVHQVAAAVPAPPTVIELGRAPGVALAHARRPRPGLPRPVLLAGPRG